MKPKLIINLFLLLVIGILGTFLIGCKNSSMLQTPIVSIKDNVLEWTKVTNAIGYEVHIDDNVYTVKDNTLVLDLNDGSLHKIGVKAISSSEKNNSKCSSLITYKANFEAKRLDSPYITLAKNKVSWEEVEDATKYEVHIGVKKQIVTEPFYNVSESEQVNDVNIFVIALNDYEEEKSLPSNIIKYQYQNSEVADLSNMVDLFTDGNYKLSGTFDSVLKLVSSRQLYDKLLWSRFVEQFRSNTDGDTYGWRGEFWGKMMEGACITYQSTKDEKLYNILTMTVEDMLTTQHPDGSITSYGKYQDENNYEFEGWDMWCRNWSITGMIYYYGICKDNNLKTRVLKCVEKQLDYIICNVGDGKININDTASQWGGLPSSTILESVCKMYSITNKYSYLDFATHIINQGGSKNGNQIEQALENKTYPYTWGAPKAGELCLFFDGVLEYYKITGIEKYKKAVINYWYLVNESEITIVGGGCTKDEQFEHSVVEQCDPSRTNAMQEYCVTIHWLNLSKDVYQLTQDSKIIDSMERTIYNAVLCCIDNEGNYNHVFTSYNNLMFSVRSTSAAGGMHLNEPESYDYGCCISQGSIATGQIPKLQYAKNDKGLFFNLYLPGESTINYKDNEIKVLTETTYPKNDTISLTLSPNKEEEFAVMLRIPSFSKNTEVLVNGIKQDGIVSGDYYAVKRVWKNNDKIEIKLDLHVEIVYGSKECSNKNGQYNAALVYGPITFARDRRLDDGVIIETIEFDLNSDGTVKYEFSNTAKFENIIEIEVKLKGDKKIHLVNYGNAGKTYTNESMFTVYMPTTDYWKTNLDDSTNVILVNSYYKALLLSSNEDNLFHLGNSYHDYSDCSLYTVNFISTEDGYYFIKQNKTNKYLSVVEKDGNNYLQYADYSGNDNQEFKLENSSLMTYKLCSKITSFIVSANNETDAIWLYSDCNSTKQYWEIITIR